ncbi:MAG TPA: Rieske 2Fe-2S domain-containing protein [Pyrinomonadaceae bacterium]|nr:Rieske 2Fe-2S domain-containing protein [Pyrinomonadaceae bacterium]
MTDTSERSREAGGARTHDDLRRRFLLWIPAAVFGAAAVSLLTTAYRFLRPRAGAAAADADPRGGWLAVGRVSEMGGGRPLRRAVTVERRAGWSLARREQAVFVLPGAGPRVVSAVCPHEGCEVEWDAGASAFLCPCHDSRFGPDGERTAGPAERGLARLPARVTGDVLEVLYEPSGGGPDAPAVQG